jgi:hypothetical protein
MIGGFRLNWARAKNVVTRPFYSASRLFYHLAGGKNRRGFFDIDETSPSLRALDLYAAFFSILDAGKSAPAHDGPYCGYLRYHLGLIVPRDQATHDEGEGPLPHLARRRESPLRRQLEP